MRLIKNATAALTLAACSLAALTTAAPAQENSGTNAGGQIVGAPAPSAGTVVGYGTGTNARTVFVLGSDAPDHVIVDAVTNPAGQSLVVVSDRGGRKLTPGARCSRSAGGRVACPRPWTVNAQLRGGNDSATVTRRLRLGDGLTRMRIELWGGAGNDLLEAQPGSARVILLGQEGADSLRGSSGPEALWGGPGDDRIHPRGGTDHIDGGHGDFTGGPPRFRGYVRSDAECTARTHGPFDLGDGPMEGRDTLDLSDMPRGMLVDLDVCRLTSNPPQSGGASLVHAIENVVGSRFNDRLAGDADNNALTGRRGADWMAGNAGADQLYAKDGEVDTVHCGDDRVAADRSDRLVGCVVPPAG